MIAITGQIASLQATAPAFLPAAAGAAFAVTGPWCDPVAAGASPSLPRQSPRGACVGSAQGGFSGPGSSDASDAEIDAMFAGM
jgi:hypothetical protein